MPVANSVGIISELVTPDSSSVSVSSSNKYTNIGTKEELTSIENSKFERKCSNIETVFTYKPSLNYKSTKLAKKFTSNFIARQQQHVQAKQRQLAQATSQIRTVLSFNGGKLSPISQTVSPLKHSSMSGCDVTLDSVERTETEQASSPSTLESSKSKLDRGDLQSSPRVKATKTSSTHLQRLTQSPYHQGANMAIRASVRGNLSLAEKPRKGKHSLSAIIDQESLHVSDEQGQLLRCRTMPPGVTGIKRPKISRKLSSVGFDRVQKAKGVAEKAMKAGKVFTIQGGYSMIRHALRARGWVEKFYKMDPPPKKKDLKKKKVQVEKVVVPDSDSDTDTDDNGGITSSDDDDDGKRIPPWEEDGGIYGIMSRVVKNCPPTFIWVLRRDIIDFRYLRKDQLVNHYCKASSFTTKVGLCVNLRQLPWFDATNPDEFFPRCYRLSVDEEKEAFIDDYRYTTAMCVLKWLVQRSHGALDVRCEGSDDEEPLSHQFVHQTDELGAEEKLDKTDSSTPDDSTQDAAAEKPDLSVETSPAKNAGVRRHERKLKRKSDVPMRVVDLALRAAEQLIVTKEHNDIDDLLYEPLAADDWALLIKGFYDLCHNACSVRGWRDRCDEAAEMLEKAKPYCAQSSMDGIRNIWMVKPGAKSRGRGIVCKNKLEDILSLVQSQVVKKEGKYVVQKYIERPLLVYNTKFDIRQWFLVTDWNPLTIWFYKDSYLRFCSQMFTMDKLDESIHLSNYAIQKHYRNQRGRPDKLPADNMWSCWQFSDYLKQRGHGNLFDESIYPGMKKAIVCSLLCTQDVVEYRKNSFELYGADFMLTEDFQLMLIEINSSPSMDRGTKVTSELCPAVLEDCLKVVLDRRKDKNCDTGRFELAFKAPQVNNPPYIGINLSVEGKTIRAPRGLAARRSADEPASLRSIREVKEAAREREREVQESLRESLKLPKRHPSRDRALEGRYESSYLQSHPTLKQYVPRASASSGHNVSTQRMAVPSTSVNVSRPVRKTPVHAASVSVGDTLKSIPRVSNIYGGGVSTPRASRSRPSATDAASHTEDGTSELSRKPIEVTEPPRKGLTEGDGERAWVSGPWGRSCPRCGFGNNLHLDTLDMDCSCRRDGVYVDLGVARSRFVPLADSRPARRSSSPGRRGSVGRPQPAASMPHDKLSRGAYQSPALARHRSNGSIWTPDANALLGQQTKVTLRYDDTQRLRTSRPPAASDSSQTNCDLVSTRS